MKLNHATTSLILFIWAIIVLVPLLIVATMSVKSLADLQHGPLKWPETIQISNYWTVWTRTNMGRSFLNSMLITSIAVSAKAVFSAMAAYPLSRIKAKWTNVLYIYFLSGMMVPFQVAMIPLYKLMHAFHLIGTYPGAIFIYIAIGLSFPIFLNTSFFKTVPRELEESALIDGCGPYRTFWTILFPLMKPITSTVLILGSLFVWNDFFIPLLFLQGKDVRTIPLALYSFTGEFTDNWTLIFAAVVLGSLPLVILFLSLQKQFIQGISSGAVKG